MMKSVALLDSIPSHDDDFVLVDHTGQTDDEDNDSFDFCEDALSLSSSAQHQATILTATSNPLQVVQENFFVPKENNNSCDNENNNSSNGDHPTEVNPLNLNSSLLPNQETVLEEGDGDPTAAKTDAPLLTTTHQAASLETLTVIASNEEEELSSFLASSASQILSEQDDSAPFAVEPPPLSEHGQDLDVTHLTTAVQQDLGVVEPETRSCGPSESKDKAYVVDDTTQIQQEGTGSVADEFDVSPLSIVAALSSLSNQQDSSVIGSAKKGGNHEIEQVVNQTEEEGSQTTSSSSRAPSSSTSSKSTASSPNNNKNSRVEKKKRRKQLKLAKKAAAAAAAAAALGQFTALKAKASPKRKKGKKVANIAVAEAVKSHQEYNQTHLLGKTSTNKKLR